MKRFCIALGLVLSLVACTPDSADTEREGMVDTVQEATPGTDIDTGVDESLDEALDTSLDVNRFGFNLYHSLREDSDENLVISPLSVALALGMILPGADEEAAVELLQVLHASDVDAVNRELGTLRQAMEARGQAEGITLTIANRGFVGEDFSLDSTYVDTLSEWYDFGMETVDYGQPEAARGVINQWVSERTNDLIEELLPSGSIDADTRLTLVNAIYLLADWQEAFDEEHTANRSFFFADGSEDWVPTMRTTLTVPVHDSATYQAVELPYRNEELALLIVTPKDLDLASFEETLDAEMFDAIVEELSPQFIELSLPKLETRFNSSLQESLQDIGAERIFCGRCNALSGIAPPAELAVSDVVHETYLRMDEKGTEAAAATGVVVAVTSAPLPVLVLKVDRPYFMALRDRETGAILFLGRVMDPR